jgi:hypothetical protein
MNNQITKSLILGFHNKGFTQAKMALEVQNTTGIRCSINQIKRAYEAFGLDAKKKNRFLFEFVDDTNLVAKSQNPLPQLELAFDDRREELQNTTNN